MLTEFCDIANFFKKLKPWSFILRVITKITTFWSIKGDLFLLIGKKKGDLFLKMKYSYYI